MKHTLTVTIILILVFFAAQVVGLAIVNQYIDIQATKDTGKTVVRQEAYNITGITPPPIENESMSWIFISAAVIFGTVLVLLIIRFRSRRLWKTWFFFSVLVCLTVAFAPFIGRLVSSIGLARYAFLVTLALAALLAYIKIFRPNPVVHNLTEIFIYGGLAALLVPVMNISSAVLLLLFISAYDMFAVWRSKHMVKMAKFQTEAKVFAGLMINYGMPKSRHPATAHAPAQASGERVKGRSAILGGGDIAFPLLFSGVVMKTLASYAAPLLITLFAGAALFALFVRGQKDKFYPAMPFISLGCFAGYGLVLLIGF